MIRPITLVGAPTSIGIRPYDDGEMRRLDLAPGVLREQGLVARVGARDLGDVIAPPYRDFVRPAGRPRNESEVAAYSRALGDKVASASADGTFALVLGGDCSIVLGCLLGLRTPARSRIAMVYVDAHADFATPETSRSGSVASMCLAIAVGRGDTPLARLVGDAPLTRAADLVTIGRRDDAEAQWYGEEALAASGALELTHRAVRERGAAPTAQAALDRVGGPDIDGFWIHVDADVLDPSVLPAVDSPEPNGLELDELADILIPLVRHPRALGLELTIYDPNLDPDSTSAGRLVSLLERVLGPSHERSNAGAAEARGRDSL